MTADDSRTAAQLRALAATTPDVLLTIDADSIIRYVNPAVEDVLGYRAEKLIGEPLTVLMPDELGERHLGAMDRYLETGTRRLDWDHVELPAEHSDGHLVPLGITFSEFSVDGERFFAGILRDRTEKNELEAERDLLHTVKDRIFRAESLSESLRNAVRLLGDAANWTRGEAWLAADEDEAMELAAAWDADGVDPEVARALSERATHAPEAGFVDRVRRRGEHEWIPDVTDDDVAFDRTAAAEAGIRAAFGVPIRSGDTVVAVLVFLSVERRSADERAVEIARTVAANLGLLIGRRRAEDALREERDVLSHVLRATPVGVVVIDADGTLSYVNHRAEEYLRMRPDAEGSYPPVEELPIRLLDEEGTSLSESEWPYQSVFRTGESVSRDVQVEYPDGDRRWFAIRGTPLRTDDGAVARTVFAVQDVTERRRRTDRLERLSELGRDLADADDFEAACERAVAAATAVLDLPVASVERYDADSGSLEPFARTSLDGEFRKGTDADDFEAARGLAWEAFVRNEALTRSDVEPNVDSGADSETDDVDAGSGVDSEADGDIDIDAGSEVNGDIDAGSDGDADGGTDVDFGAGSNAEDVRLSSAIAVPIGRYGVLVGGATEPDALSEATETLAEILAGNLEAALERLERERDLRERTEALETKNRELQRVQRVNREILDIARALRNATSREEITQVVCDRLARSDQYEFVWFGEPDPATDEVRPTASAGAEEGYLDAVTVTADETETGRGPAGRAIRTGEAQIQNDLLSDPPFEPWRREAMRRGYGSVIAVPVAHGGTQYGVLNLYANEPEVFSEMEEAALTEFGEMIGYALRAMERYDALVAEESVELEFVVRDPSNPLLTLLREREGSFSLETISGRSGGAVRVFVSFAGVSFEDLRSVFAGHVDEDDMTLVREREGELVVELLLPSDSVVAALLERGAMPTGIRGSPEGGRVTIRIPKSGSVREFVEFFEDRYDDVELVARRESSDPVRTREEFERTYVDRLTERQREVLRTAYFAGFFEQPRASSARDVAELLGVSQPTVSRHLRSSQETLFSMLFGDD